MNVSIPCWCPRQDSNLRTSLPRPEVNVSIPCWCPRQDSNERGAALRCSPWRPRTSLPRGSVELARREAATGPAGGDDPSRNPGRSAWLKAYRYFAAFEGAMTRQPADAGEHSQRGCAPFSTSLAATYPAALR